MVVRLAVSHRHTLVRTAILYVIYIWRQLILNQNTFIQRHTSQENHTSEKAATVGRVFQTAGALTLKALADNAIANDVCGTVSNSLSADFRLVRQRPEL